MCVCVCWIRARSREPERMGALSHCKNKWFLRYSFFAVIFLGSVRNQLMPKWIRFLSRARVTNTHRQRHHHRILFTISYYSVFAVVLFILSGRCSSHFLGRRKIYARSATIVRHVLQRKVQMDIRVRRLDWEGTWIIFVVNYTRWVNASQALFVPHWMYVRMNATWGFRLRPDSYRRVPDFFSNCNNNKCKAHSA